jgi:hypothetical protein
VCRKLMRHNLELVECIIETIAERLWPTITFSQQLVFLAHPAALLWHLRNVPRVSTATEN